MANHSLNDRVVDVGDLARWIRYDGRYPSCCSSVSRSQISLLEVSQTRLVLLPSGSWLTSRSASLRWRTALGAVSDGLLYEKQCGE